MAEPNGMKTVTESQRTQKRKMTAVMKPARTEIIQISSSAVRDTTKIPQAEGTAEKHSSLHVHIQLRSKAVHFTSTCTTQHHEQN